MKNVIDLTVLYVEDSNLLRSSVAHILQKKVSTVFIAENGKLGLEAFRQRRPDVVITDIGMPVMDGIEMLKRIREEEPKIPTIVTTTFEDTRYLLAAIEIGVDFYVLKSKIKEKLLPSIERCHELVVANRIAEQQLEYHQNVSNELLEKAPILVAVTTAEGKIEFINERMVDTYGYTMEELISNEISVLKGGETPDEVFKELWETISNGEEWSGEFVNKSKSGDLFIEEARVVPLTDPTGEIRFFLKIARDVTEERALREQLDEARERIAELEEAAKGAGASGAGAAKAVSAKPAEDHDEPAITVSARAQTVEEAERYRAALQKAKNDGSGSSAKKSPGSQTAVKKPSTARKGAGKSGGTKRKR